MSERKRLANQIEGIWLSKAFDDWFCEEYKNSSSSNATIDDLIAFLKKGEKQK